jgi:hypothetical protein
VHVTSLLVAAMVLAAGQADAPVSDEEQVRRCLAAAATLYASLENEKALEQILLAKKLVQRVEDSVQISLYEGLILSDSGRTEEGASAFRAAFALDPNVRLPVKVSPRLSALIETLRAEVRSRLSGFAPPAPAPVATVRAEPGSTWRSRAWIPAVAGGALLAGAGVSVLLEKGVEGRLNGGDSTITNPSQLESVYQQGRGYTFAAEGLAVAGAAAACLAGAMWLWGGGDAPAVGVVAGPRGAIAAIGGTWR